MPKLSYSQTNDLVALRDRPKSCSQASRSCTNSTLCALKRRGLVELFWKTVQTSFGSHRTEHWKITEAGRAAIAR